MKVEPLTASDIVACAVSGVPIAADRTLATFADPRNWVQLYDSKALTGGYEPRACEWAWIGPNRPPYELAQWALKEIEEAK